MSFKIGGFSNFLESNNQTSTNSANTPAFTTKQMHESYAGGTLLVKIKFGDTQETFAHRGLVAHAVAAGLSKAEAGKFADKWTNQQTTLKHYANGNSHAYTENEFAKLKTKEQTTFELSKEYDSVILADLNERVEEHRPIVAEEAFAYTPDERQAIMQQHKGAGASQSAITNKPDMMLTNGLTKGGKPLDANTALSRYIEKNYNQNGRVWGDKINEMVSLAKTQGIAVELKFNEDGTALVGVNAADKQKLDNLFNQALGETIKGEQASLRGQQEATNQVADIGRIYANGAINTVNHLTEPVRGTLAALGVDTSAAKIPKLEYQSEMGKKAGAAGEMGTEIGAAIVSAPALLKTAAGKIIAGVSGVYNVGAGAAGVDPTEKGEDGKPREMSTLERGMRIVGGAGEILGARPNFETAGKTGTTLAQESEVVEMLADTGTGIKVSVRIKNTPTDSAIEAATAKPMQTADELAQEMAMTPEQAAKVSQLKQERFLKEAEHKLDEGIAEAKAEGRLGKVRRDEIDNYNWLTADKTGRRERLAFDPDNKNFKVQEAKVALQAEADGVVKNPVRRAIDEHGSSQGGDYIGADGKYWDVKSAKGGANEIIKAANSEHGQAENVLVDCTGMSKAEIQALKTQVDAKLQTGAGAVHYIEPKP